MVLKGKELELDAARKFATEKLKGPGSLVTAIQILSDIEGMESATTEEAFRDHQQRLLNTEVYCDPTE